MADAVTAADDDVVETGGDADADTASSEPLRWIFDGGGRAGELVSRSRLAALPPPEALEALEEEVGVVAAADEEEVAIS